VAFPLHLQGKQQHLSIGPYPELSLKDAREQRDDLRAQVTRGVDPRIHRLQCKAASDLDIVAAPKPPVSNNPFLRMEEPPDFLWALRRYGGQKLTQLGLRLLLLTGVRTGELRQAEPSQFDLDRGLWIIPPVIVKQLQVKLRKEGKTIEPYVVPLSRQAIAIVRELLHAQAKRPAQRYLLPHRTDLKRRISENTLNYALHSLGYRNRLTGHGIRATISTALNELAYPKEWVGVQLSHADKDPVRAAYNHAAYIEPRRRMMQEWADRVDRWEAGDPVERPKLPWMPQAPGSIEAYLRALVQRPLGAGFKPGR